MRLDANGNLISVIERTKIYEKEMARADRQIIFEEDDIYPAGSRYARFNEFLGVQTQRFPVDRTPVRELCNANINSPKAEFYIPTVMSNLIQTNTGGAKCFAASSEWFGVTYPEDKPTVQAALKELHDEGKYPATLWE